MFIENVELRMKKLYEDATLPKKAHDTDACFDVYAYLPDEQKIVIKPHETVKLHTGFSAAVPKGYFGTFMPRSGLATKEGLRPANTPSVIDYQYTGEWLAAIHNDSEVERIVEHGERICQMTLIPIPNVTIKLVDELEESERGDSGFGDSGKK